MSTPATIRVTISPEALIRQALDERFRAGIAALEADPVGALTTLSEPAAPYLVRWLDQHGYAIVAKPDAPTGGTQ